MNQKSQKTGNTIVIGMDGSLDSTITAYLLKRQGYQCIGLCVVLDDKTPDYFPAWHNYDVDEIKSVCDTLEIPFYATNVTEVFKDRVLDSIVTSKLSGTHFEILAERNLILFETLIEKAKGLKASMVATGHYAKIQINQATGAYNVAVANDFNNDESYGLSKLTQVHLKKIIFPLADMRTIEVEKVAKLLSFELKSNREEAREFRRNSIYTDQALDFVEKFSAIKLRPEGNISNYGEDSSLGEHLGVYRYHVGQAKISAKDSSTIVDKKIEVINVIPSRADVIVDYPDKLKHTHCHIVKLKTPSNFDISLPISAYCKKGPSLEKVPVTIYFKNNLTALVDFKDEQEGLLVRGSHLVFYSKSGIGGKLLASGVVRRSGFFDEARFRALPITKEEEEAMALHKPAPPMSEFNF